MPYLTPERKAKVLELGEFNQPGDLTFLLTDLCLEYLLRNEIKYRVLNDIIGALECTKLEFYRRVVSSYEDKKKEENGDVYS